MGPERVFKGATRPALLAGVPIVPLVVVEGGFLLAALWLFLLWSGLSALFVALLGAVVLQMMRFQTRQDDQRLHQIGLRLRLRLGKDAFLITGTGYWASASSGVFRSLGR